MRLASDLKEFESLIDGFNKVGAGSYEYYENEDGDRIKHGKFVVSFEKKISNVSFLARIKMDKNKVNGL